MHADDIRTLYNYHFAANHTLWNASIVKLSDEQFVQPLDYSIGSIRNHVVHMMEVENGWFYGLRPDVIAEPVDNDWSDWSIREQIRTHWDTVEASIQRYLNILTDAECAEEFIDPDDPTPLKKWQVMLHVLNHATDHRAQILSQIHPMGAPTFPQDMVFHFWGHF